MSFNNKIPTSYSVATTTLPHVQLHSYRDLGLLLSDDFSWRNHYDHITSKAFKYLGLLKRILVAVIQLESKNLYVTLVRSQLTYCSQLWNPYLIKDTVILEKIQKQATKFILSDYVSDYKTPLLKLDLLPLMYILDFYDILFFIKALKQPGYHQTILIFTIMYLLVLVTPD